MTTEQRVTALEQQVRRQQRYGMIGIALAILLIVFAGTNAGRVQDEIKARKISVVDDKGNEQISLSSGDDGGAIFLKNSLGNSAVMVSSSKNAGFLVLKHANNETAMMLGSSNNQPACFFFDESGSAMFRFQTTGEGGPLFTVEHLGKAILRVHADNNTPEIALEKSGKVIWSAP